MIIKTNKGFVKVPFEKIMYVECVNFFCLLFLEDGKRLESSCSLLLMEKKLFRHKFSKIGRSCLVNLDHVMMLKRYNSRKWSVVMDNGLELPIAYRRLVRFKKEYLQEMGDANDDALDEVKYRTRQIP